MRVDGKFKEMEKLHRALYKACFESWFHSLQTALRAFDKQRFASCRYSLFLLEFINKYIRLLDFSIASRPLKEENEKNKFMLKVKNIGKNKIIIWQ
jgi:hypothetical protein